MQARVGRQTRREADHRICAASAALRCAPKTHLFTSGGKRACLRAAAAAMLARMWLNLVLLKPHRPGWLCKRQGVRGQNKQSVICVCWWVRCHCCCLSTRR